MRRLLTATALALLIAAAPAAAASKFVIHGRGFGHGIGMSQWGAYGYAGHGWTYGQILAHYYTGTTIGTTAGKAIRVLLQSGRGSISFAGASRAGSKKLKRRRTYSARLASGRIVLRYGKKQVGSFSSPLRIVSSKRSVRLGGAAINGVSSGAYRGALELRPSGGSGLMAINAVNPDDYVKGVVPGEVSSSWPAEALKAQAVAARSYGLTTSRSTVFDQYPDARSQVYRGMSAETAATNAAVDATAGQVVRYSERTAVTYFFSASGGRTENIENVYNGSPVPYLKSVKDPYDGAAPRHKWTLTYTTKQVQARLGGLVKGSFRGIRVVKHGVSPRIVSADVVGSGGSTRVSGATLEVRLGLYDTWATFPSLAGARHRTKAAAASRVAAPAAPASEATPARPVAKPVPEDDSWRWPADTWSSRPTP